MEQRTNPDVAYNADPTYGYAVYDSVPYKTPITFFGIQFGTTVQSGWFQVGGTSAGAPQWSALIAIANQIRSENKPPLSPSPLNTLQVLTALYDNPGALNDITSGKSSSTGNTTSYSAGPGYDLVTGLGSPKAVEVVQALEDAQPIPPV